MHTLRRRLLAFGFHLLYHQLAWTYDAVAALVSLGRWQEWVETALPYIQGQDVLEIGFGPGHLQVTLNQRGLTVTGLDASPQMARRAAHRLRRKKIAVRLLRGYAQRQPFASASFDTVVATFPSEYIIQLETLFELRRVLRSPDPNSGKPQGRLVVVLGAFPGNQNALDRLTAWAFRVTGQSSGALGGIPLGLKSRFAEAGFSLQVEFVPVRSSTVSLLIASPTEMM